MSTEVSICGMLTGSCFWKMHPFMQSLQMRCPVPGHIGLSRQISASPPSESPCRRSTCISEIFSCSGQPASGMPSGFCLSPPTLSRMPLLHESLSRSWQYMQ